MLSGGDEVGRTQLGNNNAYCQDSELSWTHWDLSEASRTLLEFASSLAQLRRDEPVLQRRTFFQGREIRGAGIKDIVWLEPSGSEMSDQAWHQDRRCLGMLLPGDAIDEVDERGGRIVGATLLVLFNSNEASLRFTLPPTPGGACWSRVIDTADPHAGTALFEGSTKYLLTARSVAVLRRSRMLTVGPARASRRARRRSPKAS
jgi:glycogen operon protein